MRFLKLSASWLWRLAAAGAVHAAGLMLGGGLAMTLGLEPPRVPEAVAPDPGTAALLLFPGGMAIALGLAAMAIGLEGRRSLKWMILGSFAFVVNGLGTVIELSRFSTLGGGTFSLFANLPGSFLCALAVVLLFRSPSEHKGAGAVRAFFTRWTPGKLTARLLLALLAFPVFYFVFGMMIAPIVLPYYEQLDFIVIPPLPALLSVLLLRSALFLLVSIPIVMYWHRSRIRLAIALGAGHFTAVGLSGLLQVTIFPAVLRWTHGIEILATSVCYGLALAWLLFAAPPAARRPSDSNLLDLKMP